MSQSSDVGYFAVAEVATGYGVRDAYLVPKHQWYIMKGGSVWALREWDETYETYRTYHRYYVHNYLDKEHLEAKMREAEIKYMMGE